MYPFGYIPLNCVFQFQNFYLGFEKKYSLKIFCWNFKLIFYFPENIKRS